MTDPVLDLRCVFSCLKLFRDRHTLVGISSKRPYQDGVVALDVDLSDPNSWQAAVNWITQLQADKRNIYFHVNPTRWPLGKKATKSDMGLAEFAQVDIDPTDGVPYEQGKAEAREVLDSVAASDCPPTLQLCSGNGFYALGRLSKPLEADVYDSANKAWNTGLGAKGTFNIDRILKLPGTIAFSSPGKIKKGYPPATQSGFIAYNPEAVMDSDKFVAGVNGVVLPQNCPVAAQTPMRNRRSDLQLVPVAAVDSADVWRRFKLAWIFGRHSLRRRWAGDPLGLYDTSRSGFDMSMAKLLANVGFTYSEIYWLLTTQFPHGVVARDGLTRTTHRAVCRAAARATQNTGLISRHLREMFNGR